MVLKGLPPRSALEGAFEITRSLPHEHVAAVLGSLRALGLECAKHNDAPRPGTLCGPQTEKVTRRQFFGPGEPVAQHCSNRARHGSGGDLGLPMTEHVDAGLSDRAAGQ